MLRAYKYRIYPTDEQKAMLNKTFGCCRYAYNYCVREHKRVWEEEGKTLYEYDLDRLLLLHKQNIPWLREADTGMLRWTAMRVVNGYNIFFNSIQNKDAKIHKNPPREHKKGERPYQSFTTYGPGLKVCFKYNTVRLPKIGHIRAKLHRRFYGQIKHATVKHTGSGQYYVSLCVDMRDGQVSMKPFDKETTLGIDLGVHHFATLSDGTHIDMPDVSQSQNRKAFLQRRLKHQKQGSKGYEKTRKHIARISEHIANVRLDFHHKTAASLCSKYSAICMETLNAEQMLKGVGEKKDKKDKGFNRQLKHVGIGQFSRIMEEKAARTGTHFMRTDRWVPTTKTCHVCGHVNKDIVLGVEEWTCPDCGTHHNRDINAAINIKNNGVEQLPVIIEEKPLDEELIKEQLPLAERKVMPAKIDALASSRRTGRMADMKVCRPSTQIDDGAALPRLANQRALSFLRIDNFIKEYGINLSHRVMSKWLESDNPADIPEVNRDQYRDCAECLLSLAEKCRHNVIETTERYLVAEQLVRMNKVINIGKLSKEVIGYAVDFTWWRKTQRSQIDIDTVNSIYTQDVPDEIEKFVNRSRL